MGNSATGRRNRLTLGVTMAIAVVSVGVLADHHEETIGIPLETDAVSGGGSAGKEADNPFLAAYEVFTHPRCLNCHPAGDAPLQGDNSRPHAQNVKRGADGHGKYALKCAACHQESNLPGANMPPGNPSWHLPPPSVPMVFEGRTAGELATQLGDPAQNGGKTLAELLEHVASDPLVLWAWNPGDGRTTPPLSHAAFVGAMQEWVEQGAAAPE